MIYIAGYKLSSQGTLWATADLCVGWDVLPLVTQIFNDVSFARTALSDQICGFTFIQFVQLGYYHGCGFTVCLDTLRKPGVLMCTDVFLEMLAAWL